MCDKQIVNGRFSERSGQLNDVTHCAELKNDSITSELKILFSTFDANQLVKVEPIAPGFKLSDHLQAKVILKIKTHQRRLKA